MKPQLVPVFSMMLTWLHCWLINCQAQTVNTFANLRVYAAVSMWSITGVEIVVRLYFGFYICKLVLNSLSWPCFTVNVRPHKISLRLFKIQQYKIFDNFLPKISAPVVCCLIHLFVCPRATQLYSGILVYNICLLTISNSFSGATNKSGL